MIAVPFVGAFWVIGALVFGAGVVAAVLIDRNDHADDLMAVADAVQTPGGDLLAAHILFAAAAECDDPTCTDCADLFVAARGLEIAALEAMYAGRAAEEPA